jgi:hypothetical protein
VIEPFRELLRELRDVADAERLHVAVRTGRHDGVDPRRVARRGPQRDGAAAVIASMHGADDTMWCRRREEPGGMGNTESNGT